MHIPAYYTDDGSGFPVLFFHAFPLNADMWNGQRQGLEGCRTVTFDLPGFGRGGAFTGPVSIDESALLGLRLADHLGIDRFIAAGCSMGGYLVMSLMRNAPGRLAGVVLANTRMGPDSPEGRENRLQQSADIRGGGGEAFIRGMLPKLLAPAAGDSPSLNGEVFSMMQQASPEGMAGMLEAMAGRADSTEVLRAWAGPACVITGEDDQLIPADEARAMASTMGGAELHVLPGCGHLCNVEKRAVFNSVVGAFVRGTAGTG